MADKHIYGTVGVNGNIISGKGFSVDRIQDGNYYVRFDQPLDGEPSPVCTIFGPPWRTFNMSIAIVEAFPDGFICVTSTPDRPVDCGFTFLVVGEH